MAKGLKAEWGNLSKRRCDNCPAIFKPKRPNQKFCKPNCRKEFDKHGGTFSKLKPVIVAEVRRAVKERDPLDAAWQRSIEARLTELESFMKDARELFNFRRSA